MITQLRTTFDKYSSITSTNLQNQLVYVWDALSRAFFIIIILIIFIALWSTVYASQGAEEIAGLTLANTIWYFLIAEVMELGKTRHDMNISREVNDGTIAYTLIRPYNYLGYHFFNGLGEQAIKMSLVFLLGLPLVLWHAGLPTIRLIHLPLMLLIMALAIVIDFLFHSIIGLIAFWTEDVGPFRLIYQKLVFILGGLMIPLDFLPEWLQPIARALPFNLTTYAPAKLFVAFEWAQFWQMLGLAVVWIGVLSAVITAIYRKATRRLEVNGG